MSTQFLFTDGAFHVPLSEGEAIFFTRERSMRRMLAALLGVSGDPDARAARLYVADGDDAEMRDAALRAAQSDGVPVLLFASRTEMRTLPDGVRGICIARPFLFSEICAASSSLCGSSAPAETPKTPAPLALIWDEASSRILCGEKSVRLSAREADVFRVLYAASPAPVAREALSALFARRGGNGADVYIGYLRRKLVGFPAVIVSVRNAGYALIHHAETEKTSPKGLI